MKKLFIISFTLFLIVSSLYSQSEQMRRWSFINKQLNFSTNPPTVNSLTTIPITGEEVYNAYYDENDNLLFRVIDSKIYTPTGVEIGELFEDGDEFEYYYITGEISIVPLSRTNNCEYAIWYSLYYKRSDLSYPLTQTRYTIVNPGINSVMSRGAISSSGCRTSSITISDFIGTSETRRIYSVSSLNYCDRSTDSLILELYTMTEKEIVKSYSAGISTSIELISELELSNDLDMLVIANANPSNLAASSTNPNLLLIELNPQTGSLACSDYSCIHNFNMDMSARQIVGCEFVNDDDKVILNSSGEGIYVIDYSDINNIETDINLFVTNLSYNQYYSSQIERTTHGDYYVASNNGYVGRLNLSAHSITNIAYLGTSEIINNKLISTFSATSPNCYILPDQIDGCYYNYTSHPNSQECCYDKYTSEVITSMTGVSEDLTTGDITIEEVTASPYYVEWTQTSNPFTSGAAITDIYLKGNLTINGDAKLKIDGLTIHFKDEETLDMSYNASGIGSRLELRNSTLTAFDYCDVESMWGGIRCNGYWGSVPQGSTSTSPQPYTYMSNSTIEFAEKGIEANNGGIVKAYNSNFKDNIIDVSFVSYSYQGVDNISLFSTCDFYTTSELYNKGNTPLYHVHIWTAPGLAFYGCDFRNDYASSVSISQRGVGILSTASSITVKESCSGIQLIGYPCPDQNTTRGSFTDLYYGIKASTGSFYKLSRQDFNNCVKGSWLIASDAITVTECDFDVSSETLSGSLLYDSFGLYVESSTGYHIEGNEFHDGVLGMVVYNSHELNNNEVYRNDFYNLTGNGVATGAVGLGENGSSMDQANGLQFICNDFNQTDYAIAVLGGELQTQNGTITVYYSSIAQKQGWNILTNDGESAKNTFWLHGLSGERDFYVDYTSSYIHFYGDNYHYYGAYDNLIDRDANINSYNTSEVIRHYDGTFTTREQECPQTIYSYGGGGGIIIPLMETIGGFNDEEIELESQVAELTSYNELELEISAQTANDNNISTVYNSLNEASPNLTSQILLAYLNNKNVSELSRTSLMFANSPLPKDVVEAVRNSDLSATYKAYILKSQNGENEIEQKLNRISSLKSARQVNYDKLVRATFSADTTPEFAQSYEMVLGFLETQTDLHAKKKLADLYLHKGLYDNALAVLDDIENIALSSDDISLLNDVKITEVKIDMLRAHSMEDAQNAIRNNEEFLRELAADYNTKEGGAARAMLESADLWDNFPIVFLPNSEQTMEDRSARVNNYEDSQELIPELESLFSIYPNPADNYLSIEFINPEGNCTFSIFTIKGDLVKTVSTNQQLGFMSIDISNLEAGNYIINCKELNSSQSFMIVR